MKPKESTEARSDCPVNFAVETLGDKWSLVILRDIIFWGKRTYGEFLKSDEGIATNILAGRLDYLEGQGLITKSRDPLDKRRDIYTVTELGMDLIPMFIEMIAWSAGNETWQLMDHRHGTPEQFQFVERAMRAKNRQRLAKEVRKTVKRGGCVFEGVSRPTPEFREV
ncbi:MAG: helix-turn-helix domain-containing protein [Pyrinomonadaceae bacterium]